MWRLRIAHPFFLRFFIGTPRLCYMMSGCAFCFLYDMEEPGPGRFEESGPRNRWMRLRETAKRQRRWKRWKCFYLVGGDGRRDGRGRGQER